MKRLTILLIFLCGIFQQGLLSAQGTSISGQVLDNQKRPLENAVVALMKAKDTTLVKVMFTDEKGNYRFENVDGEKFILNVSMANRKTLTRKINVDEGEQAEMNSFALALLQKGESNDGSPILQRVDNKLVLDLIGSGVKIKGSAWDVLKTVPAISVNEDEALCYNGKQLSGIEIDGKENKLNRIELKNKLKEITVDEISGLEIMPPASNGNAIINIITVEGAKNGFYGAVSSAFDFGKTNQNADGFEFNYKAGGFNFFGSYDYSQKPSLERSFYSTTFLNDGVAIDYLDKELITKRPIEHDASVGFDYEGKRGFSIGGSVTGEQIREKGNEQDLSQYTMAGFDTLFVNRNYTSQDDDNVKFLNVHVGQLVRPMGAKFSFDYSFANDNSTWNQAFPVEVMVQGSHNQTTETLRRFTGGRNYSIAKGNFKYVQHISDNFFTVAGVKSNLTTNQSNFTTELLTNGNWMNEGILNQSYGFRQQVNTAYLMSRLDLGKFSIVTAFEAQQAISTGISQANEFGKQKSGIQLIPSAIITQTLNSKNSIDYSFTQTMTRPTFRDLDPTAQYNNSYSYTIGNPNLRPEITNNAKIEYTCGTFLSLSAGMDLTQNGIQRVSYMDDNGRLFYTKENLSKSRETTLGIALMLPIGNKLVIQNEFNVNFDKFESKIYGMDINSNTHSFNGSSQVLIGLPGDFLLNINGAFVSATSNGLVSMDARGMLNASVSKTILHDKLKIEVGVNDILNTGGINAKYLTQEGVYNYHVDSQSKSVSVSAKYVFGNLKSKREE